MNKQELNVARTVDFAKQFYADAQTATGISVFTHCLNTAKLAEKISHRLFGDMRGDVVPQDVNEIIAAIVHAGILCEIINTRSANFETVADATSVQVASMVSALSRDMRLVETKRDLEYRGRLSQSAMATQIVAVAAILCTAQETVTQLQQENIANASKMRKILTQLDADLLAMHATNRYYVLRLYSHAARNMINAANQQIKKIKRDVKAARMLEKQAAAIASNIAAKTAVLDSPVTPKERKRGRKKAARENS